MPYTRLNFEDLNKGFHELYVWKDIIMTPSSLARGTAAPELVTVVGGIKALGFDGFGTLEEAFGSFEIPHDYVEGSDLYPHIHFHTVDNDPGNVNWKFEYTIAYKDEEFSTSAILQLVKPASTKHEIFDIGPIPGDGIKIGTVCHFRIFRDPLDELDTYGPDAILSSIGVHYQADGDGSREAIRK